MTLNLDKYFFLPYPLPSHVKYYLNSPNFPPFLKTQPRFHAFFYLPPHDKGDREDTAWEPEKKNKGKISVILTSLCVCLPLDHT